ncbi:MAG: hypothetical protein ACI95C_002286 [Pseudohongiellaceae bacterium]|jgi:hypothetical protein
MKQSSQFLRAILAVWLTVVGGLVFAAENLVLVTLDGLRWQELFAGLDPQLTASDEYTAQRETILERFGSDTGKESARKIFPFLYTVMFEQGSYVGDRNRNSCAQVANDWYFSYPGYSEILTGIVNPTINSNAKKPNPEQSFLELLDSIPGFEGRTAAFASWDVFPFIFNVGRSSLHVNAFAAEKNPQSDFERQLNTLYRDTPPPWPTVRNDSFTHHYALSYFERELPKVLYVSYGEADDFAHDGKYDEYVFAANRTDRFIGELWELIQATPSHRDNTILFVAVDHGRGSDPIETWQHHASKTSVSGYMSSLSQYENGIEGSEAVWMAALGPGISNKGLIETSADCLTNNRIAATLLELLGVEYQSLNPAMGAPLNQFLD